MAAVTSHAELNQKLQEQDIFRGQVTERINQLETNLNRTMAYNVEAMIVGLKTTFPGFEALVVTLNNQVATLHNQVATLTTQVNSKDYRDDKKKRMVDIKSMLPDKLGTTSGPGWKSWRKEMLEYVAYFRPRMSMAMPRAERHKRAVEYADHVEFGVTHDDDHETRVLLVNRCSKGSPAGDISENPPWSCGAKS